jgi:hypothetical protein
MMKTRNCEMKKRLAHKNWLSILLVALATMLDVGAALASMS